MDLSIADRFRTSPALKDAPYTIRLLCVEEQAVTWLVREKDEFGEYPNIFVKVWHYPETYKPYVLLLSDSGTGLNVKRSIKNCKGQERTALPDQWNLASFLEMTLNPSHTARYWVITTHCHYDHICGIQSLLDAKTDITVFSSSYDKSYLTPWQNLQKHSLCDTLGLKAPRYEVRWLRDSGYEAMAHDRRVSPISVFHTPGHTPDSLSWWDYATRMLCVGDMFYERESDETRSGSHAQWAREPPMPVMFDGESNMNDWTESMQRLLTFVRYKNEELDRERRNEQVRPSRQRQDGHGDVIQFIETPEMDDWSMVSTSLAPNRVFLSAAHVTVATDAESALAEMLAFMARIQADQVPKVKVDDRDGSNDMWLWDDGLSSDSASAKRDIVSCRYSVRAPWSVIHPGTGKV